MNSNFYITLKKVIITNDDYDNHLEYDNAVLHLKSDLCELQKYLKEVTPKTANVGKNYVDIAFTQISKEKIRIKKYFTDLPKPDIKKLSKYDIENYDAEIDYFSEILNLIDDAMGDLLEYLIGIYPDEYRNEKCINLVKELLPDSSIIKLQFLGEIESNKTINSNKKNNANYNKPVFYYDCIDPLFDILKGKFDCDQHINLKEIIKTGSDLSGPLIFKGPLTDLAGTFRYLLDPPINRIEVPVKKNLENWIRKNFKYLDTKGTPSIIKESTIHDYISKNKFTLNSLITIKGEKFVKSGHSRK